MAIVVLTLLCVTLHFWYERRPNHFTCSWDNAGRDFHLQCSRCEGARRQDNDSSSGCVRNRVWAGQQIQGHQGELQNSWTGVCVTREPLISVIFFAMRLSYSRQEPQPQLLRCSKMVIVTSNCGGETASVTATASTHGIAVRNNATNDVTAIVMAERTVTQKAMLGLCRGCVFVTPEWFNKVVTRSADGPLLRRDVDPASHSPPLLDKSLQTGGESVSWDPDVARSVYVEKFSFLFIVRSCEREMLPPSCAQCSYESVLSRFFD